jgi:hypothetical protein
LVSTSIVSKSAFQCNPATIPHGRRMAISSLKAPHFDSSRLGWVLYKQSHFAEAERLRQADAGQTVNVAPVAGSSTTRPAQAKG